MGIIKPLDFAFIVIKFKFGMVENIVIYHIHSLFVVGYLGHFNNIKKNSVMI